MDMLQHVSHATLRAEQHTETKNLQTQSKTGKKQ
jgi:hypothetical protein